MAEVEAKCNKMVLSDYTKTGIAILGKWKIIEYLFKGSKGCCKTADFIRPFKDLDSRKRFK